MKKKVLAIAVSLIYFVFLAMATSFFKHLSININWLYALVCLSSAFITGLVSVPAWKATNKFIEFVFVSFSKKEPINE